MDFSKFTFRLIEADTEIKPFDCGDADLNEFLVCDAKNYLRAMMALTYLLEDNTKNKTAAYYSLLNDKIIFDPEDKHFWDRLNRKIANDKRRKEYPAVIVRTESKCAFSGIRFWNRFHIAKMECSDSYMTDERYERYSKDIL